MNLAFPASTEAGRSLIEQAPTLRVRQRVDKAEVFIGWERKNRYMVDDGNERICLQAEEAGGGAGSVVLRQWLKGKRPFHLDLRDTDGSALLSVKRPFTFFLSEAEVLDEHLKPVGKVRQRWSFLRRRYTLEGPAGNVLAELFGPLLKPWTFEIQVGGRTQGFIRKVWAGLGKELFTKADHFTLQLGPGLDPTLRRLCLGATFLIDYVHFERNR
jgi:uncharacterized protein YxjI